MQRGCTWFGLGLLLLPACGEKQEPARPNVLFVVWDTVRADRMSLYGYKRATTPALERWAKGAMVFEDCLSTASSTVPSHGAMFTGLYPSEHGANNLYLHLDQEHETLAEIFREAGYGTYLYSANPHLSREENFTQGFEREEHPWDPGNLERALSIVRAKLEGPGGRDTSSELPAKLANNQFQSWDVKASGELAEQGLLRWLQGRDQRQPFFAFLNYMEAHRPYVPGRAARGAFMDAAQVSASYAVDRSWERTWNYTFGLEELSQAELELTERTYDACLLELDQLFEQLLASLTAAGHLEDTIVVLVADHGEHLGEQHMLDHQYSLYQGLLQVPLVLWNPKRVAAGRSAMPVANFDLFPTLLELCALESSLGAQSAARSLLAPEPGRQRLSEYPSDFEFPIQTTLAKHPDWDPTAWRRRLSALNSQDHKLIWASDGRHELYDLAQDPAELVDLAQHQRERLALLRQQLAALLAERMPYVYGPGARPELQREQRERLEALGYFGPTPEHDE